jgi:hypothetical protein
MISTNFVNSKCLLGVWLLKNIKTAKDLQCKTPKKGLKLFILPNLSNEPYHNYDEWSILTLDLNYNPISKALEVIDLPSTPK